MFNSETQGRYAETDKGRTYTFTAQPVRYVRDWLNGSTSNTGDHWVEIEVWGTADTVYIGNYYEWVRHDVVYTTVAQGDATCCPISSILGEHEKWQQFPWSHTNKA